jgi:hypothetical protein
VLLPLLSLLPGVVPILQRINYHSMDQMLDGLKNILLASTAAEAKAAAPATAAAASG